MQNITRQTLKDLLTDDKKMATVFSDLKNKEEETKLNHEKIVKEMQKEINFYKAKYKENQNLKMNEKNLTQKLKTIQEQLNDYTEIEGKLKKEINTITKDRDAIQAEHIICKRHLLRQIYTCQNDLKKAKSEFARQEDSRIQEIQALHLEVQRLTEITHGIESTVQKATNQKWEIIQKNEIIKLDAKKYSELEEQLDRVIKKNELCELVVVKECKHKNNNLCKETQDLKTNLHSKTRQLAVKNRKLEQKDHIIKEKEKQCEKLKDSMSRMLPPEKAELISKCQWVIREQSEKITALKAQSYMFQVKAEECKAELEKAIDREETNKKLYLYEKKRNYDLTEALKLVSEGKSGKVKPPPIVNVPEGKSGKVKLPPIDNVPEGKSGKVKLPPIVNVPEGKSGKVKPPPIVNVPEGKSGKVKLPPIVNVPEGKSGKVKSPHIDNVPEGKSGKVKLPHIDNVPESKSGKVKLPHIDNVPETKSGKVKLPPIDNVPHNQSRKKVTPQKRKVKIVVLKPEEKLILPPVTNTR